MNDANRADLILKPGQPRRAFPFTRPSLTVGPYQVAIVIRDGRVEDIFSQGKKKLPKGEVQTYVAATAPFNLTFWLKDPSDPAESDDGIALDQPVLTSDNQPVTGRIDLTLSLIPNEAERILQVIGPNDDAITRTDVADAIKSELLAKVLALDIHNHTAADLRGNRGLFMGIYNSLQTELDSTISRFGLRLDNFFVNWGLTPEEQEHIKDQRHRADMRDRERQRERDAFSDPHQQGTPSEEPKPARRSRKPLAPPTPPTQPTPSTPGDIWVYTDLPTNQSRIHRETCRYAVNCHKPRCLDNYWHGPYASKEEAASNPKTKGTVHECKVCRP